MGNEIKILSKEGVKVQFVAEHSEFGNACLKIDEVFSTSDNVLHRARNVIKEVEFRNSQLIIKSFRVPGLFGRVMYSFFRASKAKRSFEYSLQLNANNIKVPSPVAYVECYKSGLLKSSFYISEKFNYNCTLHEVLRDEMFSYEEVLPEVAQFAFNMNQKGFLHLDFSPGNILVQKDQSHFQLAMVDVNRMQFGTVDFELGLKGLTRLLRNQKSVEILAIAYADCAGQNRDEAITKLERLYKEYTNNAELIGKIKTPLKRMLGRA